MRPRDLIDYDIVLADKLRVQQGYVHDGLSEHLSTVGDYMRGEISDDDFIKACNTIVGRIKCKQELETALRDERARMEAE